MENSRTKNSALTMMLSGMRQVFTILLAFVSRTVFIYTLGAEYLGLNGLFSNILSILALSELGIGAAIAFYLYKPLVDKDIERIKILMKFYCKCYNYVGLASLVLGCCLMPFLHYLVNLEQALPENLYIIYFIFILQNACTYFFFAYKQTLVSANQELYKIEKYNIAFSFINCITDIVILLIFRNFIVYLLFKLVLVIVKNLVISNKINHEYPYITHPCTGQLTKAERHQFFRDLYSISVFKIGSTFYNTLSNLIISIMIGTVAVGYYSNYFLITSQVTVIYILIMTAISAGVGNVMACEPKNRQIKIYNKLSLITFLIYSLFTICLFQLFNSFMNVWLGAMEHDYILSQWVVLFICLNFYIDTSCQLDNVFRNAGGYFKIGQYLQVGGGLFNVVLAIPLCHFYGLAGIFAAQMFSKLLISYFPLILKVQKTIFGFKQKMVMVIWVKRFLTFIGIGAIVWLLCLPIHETTLLNFLYEVVITLLVTIVLLCLVFHKDENFIEERERVMKAVKLR